MDFSQERVEALVVPVVFAGKEYRFEIDTASANTEFDSRLAGLLRPSRTGLVKIFAPGGVLARDAYEAPAGRIGALRLPRLDRVTCGNMARPTFDHTPKVDGILGADALRASVLQLDFDRGKISFLRALPSNPGARVGLAKRKLLPTITAVLGHCGERSFVLDTGYNGEVGLSHADFAALLARGQILLAGSRRFGTAAGIFSLRTGVLDAPFSVVRDTHRAVSVSEQPDINIPDGTPGFDYDEPFDILGLDFLSRYAVTFDFPHRAVYLKPGASFRALRLPVKLCGIRVVRDVDKIVVLSARYGSEAAPHGRANDILETINGVPMAGMRDSEIARLLSDGTIERKLDFGRPASRALRSVRAALLVVLVALVIIRRLRRPAFFAAYGVAAALAIWLVPAAEHCKWSILLEASAVRERAARSTDGVRPPALDSVRRTPKRFQEPFIR